MSRSRIYPGIDQDHYGGMTDIGRIIRDAWVLGLLPETQTCAGWNYEAIQQLYEKVHAAWDAYGHLVSRLPPELLERHQRIHNEATRRAREMGWNPDLSGEEG
jgi:hypothetical protein